MLTRKKTNEHRSALKYRFTGEHIGRIMGGPMIRIHYSKKIVNFH